MKITYREIEDGDPESDAGEDVIPVDSGPDPVLEAHRGRQDEARAGFPPGRVILARVGGGGR